MTCEEWEEAVCGPELVAHGQMAQHLSSCANCQATWRVLQLAVPSQAAEVRPLRKSRKPMWVGLSALAAMVVGVVLFGGRQSDPSTQEEGPVEFGYVVSELFVEPQQVLEMHDEMSAYEVPWNEEELP